jgi:hypothetical protein
VALVCSKLPVVISGPGLRPASIRHRRDPSLATRGTSFRAAIASG